MTLGIDDFESFHAAVHGREPFAWQSRLLRQLVTERAWPRTLDLPTGSGKTTCIDIALFALALDASAAPTERWCARRIAMVVDRRIVVDQVAERGRKLLGALTSEDAGEVVCEVARRLRSLSKSTDEPLGVFTLRGGVPKDNGWARTPDQPLILASTVDQLGSRLLLQGYGVSPGMRPVHAGLLGNDTLLLLDEVHLSQPFAQTLEGLARLRAANRFVDGVSSRFTHAFLSATPIPGVARLGEEPFRLTDAEKAADSPLGPRLHARKPARLISVDGREALVEACVEHAEALARRHDVVAVVVNRVASALQIAATLRQRAGDTSDVVLLTGRMRPLDRDDVLRDLRPRIETDRKRLPNARKLVVVGTQCIEAGADFDFDAIVTESASLDALRQRFGRVDRLGHYVDSAGLGKAEGLIVHDKESAKDDPVYGDATGKTVKWLSEQISNTAKSVDFGCLALEVPVGDALAPLVAPAKAAPTLLPVYMDLWMQTSPEPAVVPDVAMFLHGPDSGPADVQVIWRADLTTEDLGEGPAERVTAIVAAVKPSALEAISLPFATARRWLGETIADDMAADVEGQRSEQELRGARQPSARRALRWRGDRSETIDARELRPGNTIVVPATYGGLRQGCFDATAPRESVTDLAERASMMSRAQPMLRLHPAVLAGLGLTGIPTDDVVGAREWLATREEPDALPWREVWRDALGRAKQAMVVEGTVEPWSVLLGRRLSPGTLRRKLAAAESVEDGVEVTTDEDESPHTGVPVELSVHSRDVEDFARMYAASVGLSEQLTRDLALAGWLHDIGKADQRFQLLLRGGSEIDLYRDERILAKSAMKPGDKAAQRLAQRRSRYPNGARHEVMSLAMIEGARAVVAERAGDLELVLHLIGSHHGYCRPLAPAVIDDAPVDVQLVAHTSPYSGAFAFSATSSRHALHRLDSPLADRFWSLVERYGWLELCWLEAVLRLADHRASEMEARGESVEGVGA